MSRPGTQNPPSLCRGGRPCPPKGSCEFAEDFRVSEACFAGRTEPSAPTAFEKFSRFCVGVDAHIDPMAIADSHWIFVKTAHTAGAMCSIAPYEHPGRVCPYPGGIPQIKRYSRPVHWDESTGILRGATQI